MARYKLEGYAVRERGAETGAIAICDTLMHARHMVKDLEHKDVQAGDYVPMKYEIEEVYAECGGLDTVAIYGKDGGIME